MTKLVTLIRDCSSDQGTFGVLNNHKDFSCNIGELPWRDNKSNLSCVPEGLYNVSMVYSRRFKRWLYNVKDVPGRGSILIHSGNYVGDSTKGYKTHSHGCLIIGAKRGVLDGQKAVLNSLPTLLSFESHMERKPFKLEIINGYR